MSEQWGGRRRAREGRAAAQEASGPALFKVPPRVLSGRTAPWTPSEASRAEGGELTRRNGRGDSMKRGRGDLGAAAAARV